MQVDTENAAIAKRADYTAVLNKIIADGLCPFCEKNLSAYHPRPILHRSKYWLVTENAWPYEGTKHHFLFIAIPHLEALEDVPTLMWADLQKTYGKLIKKYGVKGATFMIRSGDTAYTGASVTHLHGHLISGSKRTRKATEIRTVVSFKK